MPERSHRSASLCEHYAAGARVLAEVLEGRTFDAALAASSPANGEERAAVIDFCLSALRAYGRLQFIVDRLASRPPSPPTLLALLYITIVDLDRRPDRAYVAVDQAVRAARLIGLHPAAGFANAVLRAYLRRHEEFAAGIADDEVARWQHPHWWVSMVQNAYPDAWRTVLEAGNTHPPMTLRINVRRTRADICLARLTAAGIAAHVLDDRAIQLEHPVPVGDLPGFEAGEVSVQDWGAQRAAPYLEVAPGQRVLDACSAPGGKAAHLLESVQCDLTALDHDGARVERVRSTFERLGLEAKVRVGDATLPGSWWDGRPFDRILVDAPCSASGIARRRPDIKWRRRAGDLPGFREAQLAILESVWRTLAPGGRLLYATCSVFPIENRECMEQFASRHTDARLDPIEDLPDGQLLPSPAHDGFYYARIAKC